MLDLPQKTDWLPDAVRRAVTEIGSQKIEKSLNVTVRRFSTRFSTLMTGLELAWKWVLTF